MSDFAFPTNIKQIGSIGEGFRVYIEDYACSYLQQYAEAGGYEERLAFLVGRYMVIDGQTVLFISGLVQGLHTYAEKDILTFSDKSWQHASKEINKYFKGLDIVGWMQSQPGYGTHLNASYEKMHKKMFPNFNQVLFVIDPVEKINAFYIFDEKNDELKESLGYFIYYDKNKGMHEYMLENKIVKMKMRPLPEIPEAAKPIMEEQDDDDDDEREYKGPVIRRKRAFNDKIKKLPIAQKRMVNLLTTLSASLFIICLLTVTGLARNNGRITSLEQQLTELNTAYRNLMVEANKSNTATVFASQDSALNSIDMSAEPESPQVIVENGNDLLNENALSGNNAVSSDNTVINENTLAVLENNLTPERVLQMMAEEARATPEPATTPAPVITPPPPEPTPEPPKTTTREIPKKYTVKSGDSLIGISVKFYGDKSMVEEIMLLNNLEDADKIYFGKVLLLPQLAE